MNLDRRTVQDFGEEWSAFDQAAVSESELLALFSQYFAVFPDDALHPNAVGFDLGSGSGRWARFVAPKVAKLHLIDASQRALGVARANLASFENCEFHHASVDSIPLQPGSMDFGYSLGVLHHVPDTQAGIKACTACLRPGAPLLLYLYYDFEGRGRTFKALWRASDLVRRVVANSPFALKKGSTTMIAALVYLPLARLAKSFESRGKDVRSFPLAYYRNRSFYTMRTDALDRFGTRLEKRFSKSQVAEMMEKAGLEQIRFSDSEPFWCAVGFKRAES